MEGSSPEKLNQVRDEIGALQTSLDGFVEALVRQQAILTRLGQRIPAGKKDETLQAALASTVAVSGIIQQLRQLVPQFDASLKELGYELTAQLRELENLTALISARWPAQ